MKTTSSVSLKYGLIIAIVLIAYFMLLKLVGLHLNPWFRLFNGVIMATGLYQAIKFYKKDNDAFNYTNGFVTAVLTGFFSTVIFALFMAIYMFHFDVAFMDYLLKNWVPDMNYGGGILIFIILVEGFSSSAVLTLMFMQIFKKSTKIVQNP